MWGYCLFIAFESLCIHFLLPQDALALPESVYVTLICIDIAILLLVLTMRYYADREFAILIVGSVLLRVILMFWSEYCNHIFALPNAGVDEMTYYYNAMSNLVKDKTFTGYAQIFAWQANVFGLSKIYGKFINLLLSVFAITILRRTMILLEVDYRIRIRTLALACFLPNFAIVSGLLLRESVIIFLMAVVTYAFAVWWKQNKWGYLLLSLLASLGAAWLHSGMVACILAIASIVLTSRRTSQGRLYSIRQISTIVLTVLTSLAVLVILMDSNLGVTSYFRNAENVADIISIADAYEDGGSAYNANIVNNESTVGFIINTPFRMHYFMLAPMPWDWRGTMDIIAFVFSGLFYGYVFFKALPYAMKGKRCSLIGALFLVYLMLLMMFGWGVSNSGTALRHRDKMVMIALPLLALTEQEKRNSSVKQHRRK